MSELSNPRIGWLSIGWSQWQSKPSLMVVAPRGPVGKQRVLVFFFSFFFLLDDGKVERKTKERVEEMGFG